MFKSAINYREIGAEIKQAMISQRAGSLFHFWEISGDLANIFPELQATTIVYGQNEESVFKHSLQCLEIAREEPPWFQWAALLHDIGKPLTARRKGGYSTYHQHEVIGSEIAEKILIKCGLLPFDVIKTKTLIRNHMFTLSGNEKDSAIIRLLMKVGTPELFQDLIKLRLVDRIGKRENEGKPLFTQETLSLLQRIEELKLEKKVLFRSDLAIEERQINQILGKVSEQIVISGLVYTASQINNGLENTTEVISKLLEKYKQNM